MHIKRIKAKNIPEGLKKVKEELGPDAVILSTHQLKKKTGENLVEIVAAIEFETGGKTNRKISDEAPDYRLLDEQLKEIKDTLSLMFSSKRFFYHIGPEKELCNLYTSLVVQGLKEIFAWELVQAAVQNPEKNNEISRNEEIKDKFVSALKKRITTTDLFQKNGKGRTFFYSFVGPTGAGKTTTLAKLATHLKLDKKKRVSLISLDTYRIGAIEQLKIYASILDVPLRVASSVQETAEAVLELTEMGSDYILFDTIGKNFLVKEHVLDMKEIFDAFPQVRHLLVLPANAKDSDLSVVINTFKTMPIHSFVFTKIDETSTHGNIINQLLRFRKPVSYLGTGQRVPEDIEKADREKLCRLLLKGLV